ncbi:MAG: D-2-hydroxyacid dehydrogenase [Chitinophagales bacterium]|nr:D-2-hydroxyacid dehydrogenase [Chitinophagales bacterium]
MIRILANDGIEAAAKADLIKGGYEVQDVKISQDELASRINEFDVLTVRSATKVRKPLIDVMSQTKLVIRGGVGLDNIDVDYAQSKGISVRNTPLASSQSVAELVFAHLFGLVRYLPQSHREMPLHGEQEFKILKERFSKGSELKGKTLGFIGFGNIGQTTAKIALGCGMNVLAYDLYPREWVLELIFMNGIKTSVPVSPSTKEDIISQSDFITVHSAGSSQVISEKEFAMMKDGVGIINCARGGAIKESELIDALNSGKVAYAGIDVYEEEPTKNIALLQHERVSLTPHIGASTREAQERIGKEVVDIIMNFKF